MPQDRGKPVDFDVIREPWHKYELNDNTVIKVRYVLARLFKTQGEKPNYSVDGQLMTVVISPSEARGMQDAAQYTQEQYRGSITQDDVKYNTVADEWCEYMADDGTRLKLKMTVTNISKTNKFDAYGDPVYMVTHSHMITVKRPKLE